MPQLYVIPLFSSRQPVGTLGQPPPTQTIQVLPAGATARPSRIQKRRCGRPVNEHSTAHGVPPPFDGDEGLAALAQGIAAGLRLKQISAGSRLLLDSTSRR